jgi:hypothetical protein
MSLVSGPRARCPGRDNVRSSDLLFQRMGEAATQVCDPSDVRLATPAQSSRRVARPETPEMDTPAPSFV